MNFKGHNTERFNSIKGKLSELFNLSEKETQVYFLLLELRNLTANEISKKTKVQRTRTYEILRNLMDKGMVETSSENPKKFNAIIPRLAIDNWIFSRKRNFEKETSQLLDLITPLMNIWKGQHQEILSDRVSLISADLVKEIIPQEMKNAKNDLYLALRDLVDDSHKSTAHVDLFEPIGFSTAIKDFLERGVKLHILLGYPDIFLKKSHPQMFKTLINGLVDGTVEVRVLYQHFPQSFLLVDKNLVYIFFLSSFHNEALRAESRNLMDFFRLVWEKLWKEALPMDLDSAFQIREKRL